MLIPYLGEKSKFSWFINPYIPSDISVYSEPFGGAFGIFFTLDFIKFKNVKFIYNDKNNLNYLLFKYLKNDKTFIDFIKGTKVTRDKYTNALKSLFIEKDERQLALNWLIILTCSSPYKIGKDSWVGDSEFEVFKLKYRAYEHHIGKISEIENIDYKELIERYDSKDSFFYVDPPYKGREELYINHNFTTESHVELAKTLNNIKGRFLLSYYHFDGMEELYPNCKIVKNVTIMGTEYLIMNY